MVARMLEDIGRWMIVLSFCWLPTLSAARAATYDSIFEPAMNSTTLSSGRDFTDRSGHKGIADRQPRDCECMSACIRARAVARG